MASQAEIIRGNLRDNRERDLQGQAAATDFSGRAPDPELANGIPSTSNDAALAAHLKETRDKSEEYARLRTEDARSQWEAQATANYQKHKAIEAELKNQAAIEAMNRGVRERRDGLKALSEWEAVTNSIDPAKRQTEWTLPLDQLKDIAVTQQRVIDTTGMDPLNLQENQASQSGDAPTEVNRLQAHPTAFEDGSLYKLQNLPDGNIEVNLVTGERFIGDPLTVTRTIAESNVRTKIWARGKRPGEELPDFQSQSAAIQPSQQPTEQLTQPTEHASIADYWAAEQATALAKQFGFSDTREMLEWGENVNQNMATIQQYKDDRLALEFTSRCPDFPGTPEASDALVTIVKNNGWDYNADSLQAAHLLAVRNHVYQPVSAEALQAVNGNAPQSNRPTAPPMLKSNNPEITSAGQGPYDMPLNELRKLAIRQELDGNGPNYR